MVDANFENRGELYLIHRYEGIDLDKPYLEATLPNFHTIWGRPVHLETVVKDKGRALFSHGPAGGKYREL